MRMAYCHQKAAERMTNRQEMEAMKREIIEELRKEFSLSANTAAANKAIAELSKNIDGLGRK